MHSLSFSWIWPSSRLSSPVLEGRHENEEQADVEAEENDEVPRDVEVSGTPDRQNDEHHDVDH